MPAEALERLRREVLLLLAPAPGAPTKPVGLLEPLQPVARVCALQHHLLVCVPAVRRHKRRTRFLLVGPQRALGARGARLPRRACLGVHLAQHHVGADQRLRHARLHPRGRREVERQRRIQHERRLPGGARLRRKVRVQLADRVERLLLRHRGGLAAGAAHRRGGERRVAQLRIERRVPHTFRATRVRLRTPLLRTVQGAERLVERRRLRVAAPPRTTAFLAARPRVATRRCMHASIARRVAIFRRGRALGGRAGCGPGRPLRARARGRLSAGGEHHVFCPVRPLLHGGTQARRRPRRRCGVVT